MNLFTNSAVANKRSALAGQRKAGDCPALRYLVLTCYVDIALQAPGFSFCNPSPSHLLSMQCPSFPGSFRLHSARPVLFHEARPVLFLLALSAVRILCKTPFALLWCKTLLQFSLPIVR
nr:hypothetical protein [uncultured bacterium]